MDPRGFHRELTVIFSSDVASYSRLMQDDEASTVNTHEAYKQIISDLIKKHRGRVKGSPGDILLTPSMPQSHCGSQYLPAGNKEKRTAQ